MPDRSDMLDRFVLAQEGVYDRALSELRRGRKESHWMWFIFPQLRGLGRSEMSCVFGITGADEARRYLAHPLLGSRLIRCADAVLANDDLSAEEIFGSVDAGKLRSSATLFARVDDAPDVFAAILTAFFDDRPCRRTLERLG